MLRASLIAQLVKNHPAMQESPAWVLGWKIHWRRDRRPTPAFLGFPCGSAGGESTCDVGDLGWEDPLEEGMVTHSSILACRIPWTVIVHGVTKSQTRLSDFHFSLSQCLYVRKFSWITLKYPFSSTILVFFGVPILWILYVFFSVFYVSYSLQSFSYLYFCSF